MQSALHQAAFFGQDGVVAVLLNHGADINSLVLYRKALFSLTDDVQAGDERWTPLMYAAAWDKLSTCRLLMERGARLDLVSKV